MILKDDEIAETQYLHTAKLKAQLILATDDLIRKLKDLSNELTNDLEKRNEFNKNYNAIGLIAESNEVLNNMLVIYNNIILLEYKKEIEQLQEIEDIKE